MNIHSVALNDPETISTGLSVPLLSRFSKQPFPLSSFSKTLRLKIRCRSLSILGSTNLSYLFTSSGFYLRNRSTHPLCDPQITSSLKPGRIFGYVQLSPTSPSLALSIEESLSLSNVFDRATNVISLVGLSL